MCGKVFHKNPSPNMSLYLRIRPPQNQAKMIFGRNFWLWGLIDTRSTAFCKNFSAIPPLDYIWHAQIRHQIWPNMPTTVFGAHIWVRQIWSSELSLKISCKMQSRRVDLMSIGPPCHESPIVITVGRWGVRGGSSSKGRRYIWEKHVFQHKFLLALA